MRWPAWAGTTWPLMVAVRPKATLVRLLWAVRRTPTSSVRVRLVLAAENGVAGWRSR
jgi:hypothetical protein